MQYGTQRTETRIAALETTVTTLETKIDKLTAMLQKLLPEDANTVAPGAPATDDASEEPL